MTRTDLVLPKPRNLIANDWVPGAAGRTMDVVSPIDGQPFTQIVDSGPEDVDAAVAAARAAFDGGAWSKLTAAERGRLVVGGDPLLGDLPAEVLVDGAERGVEA